MKAPLALKAITISAAGFALCGLFAVTSCGGPANSSNDRRAASNPGNAAAASAPAAGAASGSKASEVDPCSLVTKAEAAEIMGEIKEGPAPDTGFQNDKICRYSNMSGSQLAVTVGGAERWEMEKSLTSANNQQEISGLGDEAYSIRRGTETEICIKKGGTVLKIRTTSGLDVARRAAEKAAARLL
jgi:hypothetical protein